MTSWTRRGLLTAGAIGTLAACTSGDGAAPPAPTPSSAAAGGKVPWARLERSVDGSLVRPRDPSYDEVRLLQNPRYDDQRSLAVLAVASAADVAAGIGFARDHDLPVAVRSGGHSYPGWSGGGSPRALVLDCRGLDRVELDGTTATIGPGALLADVYDTLGARDRAIAGGSCATVGYGGLALGGGVGVLTRAMGLTCDAVTSMEVVTADGRVRTASADAEPDLFWALRGCGGGHLGVVTSFEVATAEAPTVGTAYLEWSFDAAATVVAAWQEWAPTADARLWSTLKALGGQQHPDGPTLLLSATWTGPTGDLDRQLAGLLDDVPAPTVRTTHARGYREQMAAFGGTGEREAFAATSHVAYDPLDDRGIADLLDRVRAAQDAGLKEAGFSIDALGGRVGDLAPGDTAFVHREALATVQYTATFPPGDAKAADGYVRGLRAAMVPHWGEHAYVNYADASIDDYRSAYYGANAERLGRVSTSYDADGFFSQPQPL
ncbi:FAD-binding oxidoreductase [Nocardioides lianchengensis]|uniref:FAD/FMN-containing dehydrogenase n=1 Tax=Nocardioides lianchengensis TaxID=1045774 RepID=A0A1G6S6D2_9ACTN|nr:FAD-binding protein [Nocardioides lianchengensis]NYG09723.1 FAD/FMN-containing dehydrogenase [Nocardioides lianchengensis]SDD12241.1 FAD/FMN-containing dehydrogenase [Nocardioides lianchengensis]